MFWLASLMVAFVQDEQRLLMVCSTMLVALLLMFAYAWVDKSAWGAFALMLLVCAVHTAYLMPGGEIGKISLWTAAAAMVGSLLILWLLLSKGMISAKMAILSALIAKVGMIPEELVNTALSFKGMDSSFSTLSWVFLGLTSLYAAVGIAKMLQHHILSKNGALAAGLCQFFFITDIISCIVCWILIIRWKPPVTPQKESMLNKAVFSNSRRKHSG